MFFKYQRDVVLEFMSDYKCNHQRLKRNFQRKILITSALKMIKHNNTNFHY
jgi:hypothetical protein